MLGDGDKDIEFEYPLADDLTNFPPDKMIKLEKIYFKADGCLRGL